MNENKDDPRGLEADFVRLNLPLFLFVLRNAERLMMLSFIWERQFHGEDVKSLQHFSFEIMRKTCEIRELKDFAKKVKEQTKGHREFQRLRTLARHCLVLRSMAFRLQDRPNDVFSSYHRNVYYKIIGRTFKTAKALSEGLSLLLIEHLTPPTNA